MSAGSTSSCSSPSGGLPIDLLCLSLQQALVSIPNPVLQHDQLKVLRLVCRSWREAGAECVQELVRSSQACRFSFTSFPALNALTLLGQGLSFNVLTKSGLHTLALRQLDLNAEALSCTELQQVLPQLSGLRRLHLRRACLPAALQPLVEALPSLQALQLSYCVQLPKPRRKFQKHAVAAALGSCAASSATAVPTAIPCPGQPSTSAATHQSTAGDSSPSPSPSPPPIIDNDAIDDAAGGGKAEDDADDGPPLVRGPSADFPPWLFRWLPDGPAQPATGPMQELQLQHVSMGITCPISIRSNCSHLQELSLVQVSLDVMSLHHLAALTYLTRLEVTPAPVRHHEVHLHRAADHIHLLSSLHNLRHLSLTVHQVAVQPTPAALKTLAPALTSLQHLTLDLGQGVGSNTSDAQWWIEAVAQLPSLTSLNLLLPKVFLHVLPRTLTALADKAGGVTPLSHLTHLQLTCGRSAEHAAGTPTDIDADLRWLSEHLPNLAHMSIGQFDGARVTEAGLQHLAALTGLTHLRFMNSLSVMGSRLAPLQSLTRLVKCDLTNQLTVRDADLGLALGQAHSLTHLSLRGCWKVELAGLGAAGSVVDVWPHLQYLDLMGTNAGLQAMTQLSQMPELKVLFACFCWNIPPGPDGGMHALIKGPARFSLQMLDLSRTNTDDAQAEALAQIPGLTALNCNEAYMNDEGLKVIASGMPHLRHLGLCKARITDDSLSELTKLAALRSLDMRRCRCVTQAGMQTFLETRPPLRRLLLDGCWNLHTNTLQAAQQLEYRQPWSGFEDNLWKADVLELNQGRLDRWL